MVLPLWKHEQKKEPVAAFPKQTGMWVCFAVIFAAAMIIAAIFRTVSKS